MPFIYEEEHVLIRIESLGDEDIADEREGVVGCSDLYLVMCPEVVDDCRLPVHITVDSEDFRI